MIMVLAMAVVSTLRWHEHRASATLDGYDEVSRKLADEQHTLDRMRTWRIAWPSPGQDPQATQQPAEQQQIDRIRRLVKERDALAEQLGQPVKPPADENLDHSRAKP